ncbi:GNAT family N-acetyltransferase [Lentilitoribacter sp. Alg239-R112]|uniref:GNAT family N-acetyltransferase n=1 Tax=Lentilitoribacter sp. Alg239-R112 TaxID=2305987 RepID=UPI0013A6D1B2|nr:GNAT family N-acetyltransferase [Lentilitoribacter sp. Alg239-R112]
MSDFQALIRLAVAADAPAMEAVRYEAIRSIDAAFYSASELEEWVGDRKSYLEKLAICKPHILRVVAERDQEIIGFGEMSTATGLVSGCFVKTTARGIGLGQKIIAAMEARARDIGVEFLQLEASRNAKIFYLSCGFRNANCDEITISNPRHSLCSMMRKDLI